MRSLNIASALRLSLLPPILTLKSLTSFPILFFSSTNILFSDCRLLLLSFQLLSAKADTTATKIEMNSKKYFFQLLCFLNLRMYLK